MIFEQLRGGRLSRFMTPSIAGRVTPATDNPRLADEGPGQKSGAPAALPRTDARNRRAKFEGEVMRKIIAAVALLVLGAAVAGALYGFALPGLSSAGNQTAQDRNGGCDLATEKQRAGRRIAASVLIR